MLALIMGVSTFALTIFAVLASQLITEFGLDRWQIGALVTASTLTGAVLSPAIGRLTDRFGARRRGLGQSPSGGRGVGSPRRSSHVWTAASGRPAHRCFPGTRQPIHQQTDLLPRASRRARVDHGHQAVGSAGGHRRRRVGSSPAGTDLGLAGRSGGLRRGGCSGDAGGGGDTSTRIP